MGSTCTGLRAAERRRADRRAGEATPTSAPASFGLTSSAPAGDAADQLRQRMADAGQPLPLGQLTSVPSGQHDRIGSGWQLSTLERKRLPQQTLDPVSLDSPADLPRDGEPETRCSRLPAREDIQDQLSAGVRPALPEDPLELSAPRQPRAPRACPGARRHGGHQTVRRLRPFDRRRFSVMRPARVRIRVRKPCVRARLRFFG